MVKYQFQFAPSDDFVWGLECIDDVNVPHYGIGVLLLGVAYPEIDAALNRLVSSETLLLMDTNSDCSMIRERLQVIDLRFEVK